MPYVIDTSAFYFVLHSDLLMVLQVGLTPSTPAARSAVRVLLIVRPLRPSFLHLFFKLFTNLSCGWNCIRIFCENLCQYSYISLSKCNCNCACSSGRDRTPGDSSYTRKELHNIHNDSTPNKCSPSYSDSRGHQCAERSF